MSALTFLSLVVISFTAAKAGRLERIENDIKNVKNDIKNIDLKLHAYSNDIFKLKKEAAETNTKLDLILDLINDTTTARYPSQDIVRATTDDMASGRVSKLNELEVTIQAEIRRVRRAFVIEKKKRSQQQKIQTTQYLEFADKLNDTLAILHDRHDTKWTLAASSINESVVSVLGTVRDNIDKQLVIWNQSIHDNLKEHTNTTIATLDVLNHSIGSWNDTIHESLNVIDLTVRGFVNTSLIQHDNFTNTLQTKLISSLTVINDTVSSMDYSDTLSKIVDSIQSQDAKVERISSNLHDFIHVTVRLVNGSSKNEGRLEVYIDCQWGTVCNDQFDNTDALVVCKMMGYRTGKFVGELFGRGTLPIVMDEVQCTGSEYSIQECTHTKDHDCSHPEDVSVKCYQ